MALKYCYIKREWNDHFFKVNKRKWIKQKREKYFKENDTHGAMNNWTYTSVYAPWLSIKEK